MCVHTELQEKEKNKGSIVEHNFSSKIVTIRDHTVVKIQHAFLLRN